MKVSLALPVPPTPDQIAALEADKLAAAKAYECTVDAYTRAIAKRECCARLTKWVASQPGIMVVSEDRKRIGFISGNGPKQRIDWVMVADPYRVTEEFVQPDSPGQWFRATRYGPGGAWLEATLEADHANG